MEYVCVCVCVCVCERERETGLQGKYQEWKQKDKARDC